MRGIRQLLVVPAITWSLTVPVAAMARAAASQGEIPDSRLPTTLEQALIERACGGPPPASATEVDAHGQCLAARLLSLRADFGYNLSRLSASERSHLDSKCYRIRAAEEAYLDCLGTELVSLHNRRARANPAAAQDPPLVPPTSGAPSAGLAVPARQASSRSVALIIGATLGTVLVAAGIVLLAVRSRPAQRLCRVCGVAVPGAGDLCPPCRHRAAEALRQAAAERGDHARALHDEQRHQPASEEEQLQSACHAEEARPRQEAEACQPEADARPREAETIPQQNQPAATVSEPLEEVFDPYTILGVSRTASLEDIRAAYEEARSKYDGTAVAHLGDEVQAHFKAKAMAVERAYQVLRSDGARQPQTDLRAPAASSLA